MKLFHLPLIAIIMLMFGCLPLSAADKDEPPRALYLAPPKYPVDYIKENITGEAVIEFVVTTSGKTKDARVVSATHPLFGKAAIKAILKSKFTIPKKDGHPVDARIQTTIHFNFNDAK